ncbi:MAG: hypothetical protein JO211_14650 [Acidobacteriaceae bacterium]|nr:hypothetical protein [Acidobacteriaceae bacterium]
MPSNLSKTTRDHEEIRRWAEERGGKPSHVKQTGSAGDVGILRIDFPGYSGEGRLEPVQWDEWFQKFDESDLVFVYEEETAGGQRSNFNKLIRASTATSGEKRGPKDGKSGSKKAIKKSGTAASKSAKKAPAKGTAKKSSAKKSAAKRPIKQASGAKKAARGKSAKKSPIKKAPAKKASSKKSTTKKRRR